jgi:hypothetical protein
MKNIKKYLEDNATKLLDKAMNVFQVGWWGQDSDLIN